MTTKFAAEFAMRYVHLYHDAVVCASHAEYLNSRHFGGSQPFFLRTVATIAHKHVCFPVNCQAKLKSLRLRLLLLACVPCMYMCVCVNQETPPAQTVNEIVALMAKFREIQEEVASAMHSRTTSSDANAQAPSTDIEGAEAPSTRQSTSDTTLPPGSANGSGRGTGSQREQGDQDSNRQVDDTQRHANGRRGWTAPISGLVSRINQFCYSLEPSTSWPDHTSTRNARTSPPQLQASTTRTRSAVLSVPPALQLSVHSQRTPVCPSCPRPREENGGDDDAAVTDADDARGTRNDTDEAEPNTTLPASAGIAIDIQPPHVYSREERRNAPEVYDLLLAGDVKVWSELIQFDCTCKDNLGISHRACAFRWYLSRPEGTKCEICSSNVFAEESVENLVFISLVQMAVNDRTARQGGAFRLPLGAGNATQNLDAVALAMQQIRNARYDHYVSSSSSSSLSFSPALLLRQNNLPHPSSDTSTDSVHVRVRVMYTFHAPYHRRPHPRQRTCSPYQRLMVLFVFLFMLILFAPFFA